MNQNEDDDDTVVNDGRAHHRLLISGTSATSEIWIGDDHGHLVVRGVGTLDVHLLPGRYTVQFSLRGETHPVALDAPIRTTEAAIRAGPTCPMPAVHFFDDPDASDECPAV